LLHDFVPGPLGTNKEKEAADLLTIEKTLKESGWKKGQPIRLISCRTGDPKLGKQAAAHKLSEFLETKVLAPTEDIILFDGGHYVITNELEDGGKEITRFTKSTGTWKLFGK
jgi:pantothenate kinase